MAQTIFELDQPQTKHQKVTYDLVPSQHLVNIRSVLASRKRKSNSSSVSPSSLSPDTQPTMKKESDNSKQKHMVFDDMISGLPSPPVESPMAEFPSIMTPNHIDQSPPPTPSLTFTPSSPVSTNKENSLVEQESITVEEIKSKLAQLREEKHNLFQLMKRLVEQEEQQKEQQKQQEEQKQAKKKKLSRWSTCQQQPTPLPSPSLRYTPNVTTTSRSMNPVRPTHSQVRNQDGYFGSSQRLHRSHQPPFLY
ncbi:hypothetical protein BC941DRAFT_425375 [Chlamydoabsidia padenii]|nr:hypothetical protein BC941DRAFT_425375 [Chlamydoabsidia padenii]